MAERQTDTDINLPGSRWLEEAATERLDHSRKLAQDQGSIIDKQDGTDTNVGKARGAFKQLKKFWSSNIVSLHTPV